MVEKANVELAQSLAGELHLCPRFMLYMLECALLVFD
jgi:hypothetical protein